MHEQTPLSGTPAPAASLAAALRDACATLLPLVARWHEAGPPIVGAETDAPETLAELLQRLHGCNFRLWHLEDAARRDDLGPEHVTRCKRDIDRENQRRNDWIERLDAYLNSLITSFLPPDALERYNTETLGSGLDRLSILSLKLYHMEQETLRPEALPEHVQRCGARLALLDNQRRDLERGLLELLEDYAAGRKRPKVYRQFKMYNDPETNPELYRQGRT